MPEGVRGTEGGPTEGDPAARIQAEPFEAAMGAPSRDVSTIVVPVVVTVSAVVVVITAAAAVLVYLRMRKARAQQPPSTPSLSVGLRSSVKSPSATTKAASVASSMHALIMSDSTDYVGQRSQDTWALDDVDLDQEIHAVLGTIGPEAFISADKAQEVSGLASMLVCYCHTNLSWK